MEWCGARYCEKQLKKEWERNNKVWKGCRGIEPVEAQGKTGKGRNVEIAIRSSPIEVGDIAHLTAAY
jgi:hypothetical protein